MKFLFVFLTIFPQIVLSSSKIHFDVSEKKIYQGSLVKAKFKLNLGESENIQAKNIEGESLENTIYVNQLLAINGNPERTIINGEASIIFLKVPEKDTLVQKVKEEEVEVTWSQIEIVPTETPENLLFGEFNISSHRNILIWIVVGLGITLTIYVAFHIWRKQRNSKLMKNEKIKIKNYLISPSNYDDVVDVWKKKYDILKIFPQIEPEFKLLEVILFKHQFKKTRNKIDEDEVFLAYRKFIDSIRGGLDGI